MYDVCSSGVKITTENRRGAWKGCRLLKYLEDDGKLLATQIPVLSVQRTGLGTPQPHVGGGCGQMDVHYLDFGAFRQAHRDLLVARYRIPDLAANLEAGDNAIGLVGSEIAPATVEIFRDSFHQVGVNLLEQDDVWIPLF